MSQYIGRRIVPLHGGVWDGGKDYEELTIVLNEASGDSYISRRPVPAGTAIGDKNYWMQYSIWSAQVTEALKEMRETDAAVREELSATENRMENRVVSAENLTNANKSELNERMDGIDKRLDANVAASTDSDADYAAEVVDARMDYAGRNWANLGAMNRGIAEQIIGMVKTLDVTDSGAVYAGKTDFMYSDNLAHGLVRKKYKLNGTLSRENLRLVTRADYYVLICDVEPETEYTLFRQANISLESGYYNLKIATFTRSRNDLINALEAGNTELPCDGAVIQGCTNATGTCPERFIFTTGQEDKCVVIQLAEEIKPDYVELRKGNFSARKYSSYQEDTTNAFPVSGVTAGGCDFFKVNDAANLYTGKHDLNGYFISTSEANVMQKSSNSFIAVVPIKGSTMYTVKISGTNMALTDGTQYFKYATVKELPEDPMDMVFDSLHRTVYGVNQVTFTANAGDTFLLVLPFSKSYQAANEAWLAVAEGDGSDMLDDYSSEEWKYSPDGIFVYAKNEVYNKSQTYRKEEVYSKEETFGRDEVYSKNETYGRGEVYSRTEIEQKLQLVFEKTSSEITVSQGKSVYHIRRHQNSAINLDTWRIYSGEINGARVWAGTDIEGPVKQVGTEDFIGGCHGDEKYRSVVILLDGEQISEDDIVPETAAENVTIFVISDVYFCNSTESIAFERHKRLSFAGRKLTVENKWNYVGAEPFYVERHTGCGLYSIYKDMLVGYSTNEDCELISTRGSGQSRTMDTVYFYGAGFTVRLHTLTGKEYGFLSRVTDFASEERPRFKAYLDCINQSAGSYSMETGDTVNASFEIEIV